jgi:hypothetical protein
MRTITLLLGFIAVLFSGTSMAQCPPSVAATTVDFKWSPLAGTGNELTRPAAHGTINKTYTVNGYTVFVNVKDPNSRLAINNYTADALINTHPPYSFSYTQTNGSVNNDPSTASIYNNYLQVGMFSANSADKIEVEYIFSTPVYLCNLEISDIDADGSGSSTPGTNYISYQDEVDVVAVNGSTNVPITITPASASNYLVIAGQNIKADWPGDFNNDVNANSGLAKVFLSTSSPITKITISYSNGPQDDGASNDHHIRIGGALGVATTTTLPVSIVDFSARNVNNQAVAATLTVANQINVDNYELQRAADGINFSRMSGVRASAATQYNFTDDQPFNGVNYYRIKATDRNGAVAYSNVVTAEVAAKGSYYVYQQGGGFMLQAGTSAGKRISVSIHDAAGAVVAKQDYQLNSGINRVSLPAVNQGGLYFVSVSENGSRVYTAKLIK